MNLLILDYGSGNIKSVYNSLKFVLDKIDKRYKIIVSNSINDISKSDFIILPGVGSFQHCKESIYKYEGLVDALYETVLIKSKRLTTLISPRGFEGTRQLYISSNSILIIKYFFIIRPSI